ncbi:MAG: hypothetical protein KKH44_07815 [Bacteroidetes bacterium]|nr:hypothetical protein [Bacteroidota bacterium]
MKPKLLLYQNKADNLWHWEYHLGNLVFSTFQRYKTEEKCRLYALLFAKKKIHKLNDFDFFTANETIIQILN